MQRKNQAHIVSFVLVLILISLACATSQPTPTSTPEPTATKTAVPTKTLRPSPTSRPTKTPNFAATERAEELDAEAQAYYDKGYLTSTDGTFKVLSDKDNEWAQLNWYNWEPLGITVRDFYMSAHFKWSSAYRNADISGCGFIFAIQEDDDHYAVFLDRSRVLFVESGYKVGPTRGTGQVKFDNPADNPVEADFALIVKDTYAYVLVDEEVVGEYTLSQSKNLRGELGISLLSGTNKDFGTRCQMTNLHVWIPNE